MRASDFRDRHFRNADFAAALLDLSDGLIKRRNRDCVQRAGTLTFSRAREPTIDSRLLVITGSDQPIFHRTAFKLLELPPKDILVKRLHRFWIVGVNFKVSYPIHNFSPFRFQYAITWRRRR